MRVRVRAGRRAAGSQDPRDERRLHLRARLGFGVGGARDRGRVAQSRPAAAPISPHLPISPLTSSEARRADRDRALPEVRVR